jgi:transcriptional regulator with XRE-family HTH domain
MYQINRIKEVLSEQKKTISWLAARLAKDRTTVSHWCANVTQPSLEVLRIIAQLLTVDIRDLLVPTKRFEGKGVPTNELTDVKIYVQRRREERSSLDFLADI